MPLNSPLSTRQYERLRRALPSLLGRDAEYISYIILYGSSTRRYRTARDIDLLCVCTRLSAPRFINRNYGGKRINLHVVSEQEIRDDITSDRYGWIFLTKFLDDPVVFQDARATVSKMRALAYMRILGQWMSQHKTDQIGSSELIADAIIDTLDAWNPQFTRYLKTGKISRGNYARYVRGEFLDSAIFRLLVRRTNKGFSLARRSPLFQCADLRVILIKYWCFYMRYVFDPRYYLDRKISQVLKLKGILC